MSEKPTYEELEQRIQELEQAESKRKRAENALQESQEALREPDTLRLNSITNNLELHPPRTH